MTFPFSVGNFVFFERRIVTRKMESGGTEITTEKITAISAYVTEVVVHVHGLDKEEKRRDSDEGR